MAFVSMSYVKQLSNSRNNLNYIAFRSREQSHEQKGIFDEKSNRADVHKFSISLNDKMTSHHTSAKAFKMIVSMSRDEWNKSGFKEEISYQSIVRNVMKDYELETGKRLEWVGAEHQNVNNPHCHILLKATYLDRDGVKHKLFLNKDDIKGIKQSFQKEIDRTRGFHIEPPNREKELTQSLSQKGLGLDFGAEFTKNLIYQMQKQLQQEQLEQEGRSR